MEDTERHQELENFVKEVQELYKKYPNVTIYGDRDGRPVACSTVGKGYSTKSSSLIITKG